MDRSIDRLMLALTLALVSHHRCSGAHDAKKLSEVLESFIKKYVQCYGCGNPETVIKIKKENINMKCKACGFVSTVDPLLKLNTFIIKNPPEKKLSKAEKKVKDAQKERLKGLEDDSVSEKKEKKEKSRKEKEKKEKEKKSKKKDAEDSKEEVEESETSMSVSNANDAMEESEEEEEEEDVVWMTDTSDAAMKKRAEEQLSGATAKLVTQGNVEAEEKARKKKEKEEKRLAALEKQASNMSVDEDSGDDPVARMGAAVKLGDTEAIRKAFEEVPGSVPAKMAALYACMFGETVADDSSVVKAFQKGEAVLHEFASDPASQLAQLMALESLLAGAPAAGKARKEVPLLLKFLYEEDIIDEAIIIGWHHKANAAAVLGVDDASAEDIRNVAEPVVQWLEEASTDEEDSDSDDDE